jgi:iron complex outermembrane receptor protein
MIMRTIKTSLIQPIFPIMSAARVLVGLPMAVHSQSAADDKVFELDVFEVTTDEDFGYQSTHASEVTRMNTAIRDIPMSVTILNQEFIEDTLARSTEDVLEYVPGFGSLFFQTGPRSAGLRKTGCLA